MSLQDRLGQRSKEIRLGKQDRTRLKRQMKEFRGKQRNLDLVLELIGHHCKYWNRDTIQREECLQILCTYNSEWTETVERSLFRRLRRPLESPGSHRNCGKCQVNQLFSSQNP